MKIITILLLCLYSFGPYAQKEGNRIREEIFKTYDSSYTFETHNYISEKDFESGFIKPFRNEELKNAESIHATSKILYQNKYRIALNFYIYEYSSSSASKSTFNFLSRQNNLEDARFLNKDYDYVFIKDNFIIRLDAPCLLSRQNWNNLVRQILEISEKVWDDKNKSLSLQCFCGGDCKMEE